MNYKIQDLTKEVTDLNKDSFIYKQDKQDEKIIRDLNKNISDLRNKYSSQIAKLNELKEELE